MSLSRSCRLFGISRQAIYQSRNRAQERAFELEEIKPLVQTVRMRMPRLGTRKLYYLLKEELSCRGIKLGRDGLFDYLRRENLLIKPKKNYTKTTDSKHWLKKYPNLFKERKAIRSEEVFVSDITYIKSKDRTHYLSLVTDAYSRKIMGYHLSNGMGSEEIVQALKMAVNNRKNNKDLIHHSDRGLQYCSAIYQNELKQGNIKASMTDGYDCYQNALAERINGILKNEFLIYECKNEIELNQLIKESIDIYNNERPHLSLNFKTPNFIHEKTCEDYSTGLLNLI